ncbi:MAG: bifunctional homocysteine S-methyltransferase/methylenetetrahydrofolate reductase [Candidatus Eisenbacteria bacterium]|nr:bifunctional homocysteine S-methyltransferase/methylenetetrahydrofolate reductase [Candidatus Eisenbacteria bacterium]
MAHPFLERLNDSVLLCDGAMGTMLYAKGIFINRCFDELNLSNPTLVQEIHRDYLAAGAEIIETNTFGANRWKLLPHGLEDKVLEINRAAVGAARRAIQETHREAFVAGSIGPLGNPLQTRERLAPSELRAIYVEQVRGLLEGGIDLLMIETISHREEMEAAILAVRAQTDLPIIAQMTFGEDGLTVHGDRPDELALWMRSLGAEVVGCNCSVGPAAMLEALEEMAGAGDFFLAAQPNAGAPQWVEGRLIYFSSPEYMSTYARRFIKSCGVRVVGGCCGTTPEHIRAMRGAVRALQPTRIDVSSPVPREAVPTVEPIPAAQRSRFARRLTEGEFVTSVEISPPKGADTSRVLQAAAKLHAAGVDAINIPDGPRASARMSPQAMAVIVARQIGIEVLLHYCCRDRNLLGMQSDLLGAYALGQRNLLVITGDPPKLGDYPNATAVFDVDSIGLTRIVNHLNHGRDLVGSALGPPTSFFVGVGANPGALNLDEEVRRFHEKVEAGAEYALTQPVFDLDLLDEFLRRTEDVPIPIVVGILPLTSHRNAEFYHNEVPGMSIPEAVRERMRLADSGDEAKRVGIEIAREALAAARRSPRIRGAYVMPPFSRVEPALEVLRDVLPVRDLEGFDPTI